MNNFPTRRAGLPLPLAGLALAGLLVLPSCGPKEEAAANRETKSPRSGTKPSANSTAAGADSERHSTKSGQRDGKTSSERMTKTASGLQYEVITEGTGAKPGPTDGVTVHYHGTLPDGTVFDSSVDRNQPATFPLNGVIKGWTEGLQLMSEGSKYRFVIPPDLAYGEQGAGGTIGPNQTLVFEVELLSIAK